MNPDVRGILWALLRRGVPAAILLGLGIGTLLGAGAVVPQMLLGFLFFLVAAILVAGPVARLLAEPTGGLLLPRRYYDKPQPMYGIPESKRVQKHPQEAIAEYEKIAIAHPGEVRPHVEMIDIALTDLHDPELANVFFQRGVATLRNPAAKDHLALVYAAIRERQPPPPTRHLEWPRPE